MQYAYTRRRSANISFRCYHLKVFAFVLNILSVVCVRGRPRSNTLPRSIRARALEAPRGIVIIARGDRTSLVPAAANPSVGRGEGRAAQSLLLRLAAVRYVRPRLFRVHTALGEGIGAVRGWLTTGRRKGLRFNFETSRHTHTYIHPAHRKDAVFGLLNFP